MELESPKIQWIIVRYDMCNLKMLDADLSYALSSFNVLMLGGQQGDNPSICLISSSTYAWV